MAKRRKDYPIFYNLSPIIQLEMLESNVHLGNFTSGNSILERFNEIQLSSSKKNYKIEIENADYELMSIKKELKNITFTTKNFSLKVNLFVSKFSGGSVFCDLYKFTSLNFKPKTKKYYKLIIPIKESNFNFHFQLSSYGYSRENYNRSSINGTNIKVCGENFYILLENKDQNNYLIIQSDTKQSIDEFSTKCHSLLISLGYITGNYIADKGYYFAYNNKKMDTFSSFYFRTLRDGMKNFWQPINSNAYSWVSMRNKSKAEKIYKNYNLRNLTKEEFSKLCQLSIEEDDFLTVLFLIIEANNTSLVFRPGGYSIALETLSSIISSKSKVRQTPITSKGDCITFQNELYAVLDKYKDFDSFHDIETLKGKIQHINQMTNQEKLLAPFKELGIAISDTDLEVIKSRNAFLHGRVPDFRKLGKNRSIEEKDADLYYASTKLYTLLNLLILKYVGYDNYVLNFSKLHEQKTKYPINEDYYRKN